MAAHIVDDDDKDKGNDNGCIDDGDVDCNVNGKNIALYGFKYGDNGDGDIENEDDYINDVSRCGSSRSNRYCLCGDDGDDDNDDDDDDDDDD
ncbi:hypothetical protein PoB_007539000 [Plakobranchus ocellatus]|uniref:Prostatic spermine-binding protein-like n=1 Tax=Plakobranchus ocellatus TaxID=259542 RepID=A0AAV4DXV6_9GAST|nr:hypothetical protein PoB_007539000 [Plakobranchus ocellatus]